MSANIQIAAHELARVMALDGPEFLGQAYLLMLGRPVDPEGFRNYDSQLRAGTSKVAVLLELRESREGQAYGADVPSLWDAATRAPRADSAMRVSEMSQESAVDNATRSGYPVATSVGELLEYEDIEFIECAYRTLLMRNPDPSGMVHYLNLVRSGRSKMQVVSRLWFSQERRKKPTRLAGIHWALVNYWLASSRFTGFWFRPLTLIEGESPLERRLRVMENMLRRMTHERQQQSAELDASVADVERLLKILATRHPSDPDRE